MMRWRKSVCTGQKLSPEIGIGEHDKRILNGFTHVIFIENDVTERYINQKGHVEFEI